MTTELSQRIYIKCLKMYVRKKSFVPVYRFVDRLDLDG